jgi:hypothetical protein
VVATTFEDITRLNIARMANLIRHRVPFHRQTTATSAALSDKKLRLTNIAAAVGCCSWLLGVDTDLPLVHRALQRLPWQAQNYGLGGPMQKLPVWVQ